MAPHFNFNQIKSFFIRQKSVHVKVNLNLQKKNNKTGPICFVFPPDFLRYFELLVTFPSGNLFRRDWQLAQAAPSNMRRQAYLHTFYTTNIIRDRCINLPEWSKILFNYKCSAYFLLLYLHKEWVPCLNRFILCVSYKC